MVFNLTAVDPTAAGYLTVWPCDEVMPVASNVNFDAGEVVSNFVETKADTVGDVCIFANTAVDLVIDQAGEPASPTVNVHTPVRMLDTRAGGVPLEPGVAASFRSPGRHGASIGVSFNLTAVNPRDAGFITAYPCASPVPATSNLNFAAGETRANFVKVASNPSGDVCLISNTPVDVIVDQVAEDTNISDTTPTRTIDTSVALPIGTQGCNYQRGDACLIIAGSYGTPFAPWAPPYLLIYLTNITNTPQALLFTWIYLGMPTTHDLVITRCLAPGYTRWETTVTTGQFDWDLLRILTVGSSPC